VALVPLRAQGVTYGLVQFNDPRRGFLTRTRVQLLEQLVDRVSLALANLEAVQALRESEERYRSFVENAHDIIYTCSLEGVFTYASPNWTYLLGHAPAEVLGQSMKVFIHPDEISMVLSVLKNVILKGEKYAGIEYRVLHKDGSWRWHASNVSPLREGDGKIKGMVGVTRDITERKQKEAELLEERTLLKARVEERTRDLSLANTELSKSLRLKDEFLANMSHELRTPLTGILGLSEALNLKVYGELNQKQAGAVENIEKCGRHLLYLINDILDLSKMGVGMVKLDPTLVSVREVCQASIAMVRDISKSKKVQVELEINQGVYSICADERRLKQILVNLLSNAIKFTPEGKNVGMTVRADETHQRMQFIVWDQGIGIPPQDLSRLFRPFTQLDSALSKKYEGTGLGLSLVLKMVDLHGGGISVESEPGQGSRFTVTLPIDGIASPVPEKLSKQPPEVSAGSKTPALVLVVEDNEMNLHFLVDILAHCGYQVITAMNGEEGITRTRESLPDVILMDVQMPVLDGIQAAQYIRADSHSRLKDIPIIALTALAMVGDREKCFEAGMNDYLSKPVSIAELSNAIEAQIRLKNRA